jgi:N-acetylneuraminate synthase
MGAEIVEFHVDFDRQLFGPDAKASLTIQETKDVVVAVRNIATALANPINKNNNKEFAEIKQIFEKSLAVNKDLPKNHILTFGDLEAKKPKGFGLEASRFQDVIGMVLNRDLKQFDFLNEEDYSSTSSD